MKKLLFLSFSLLFCTSLFSIEKNTAQQMFLSYLENNNDIKNLVINAEKAQLNYQSTEINNGFDITVSTGTINLKSVGDKINISAKPSVSAKLPQTSNLGISASTTLNYKAGDKENFTAKDTSISLNIDLISSSTLEREINLKKAERTVLEAKRNLQSQTIKVETAFYNQIKSLLESTDSLLKTKQSLYDDTLSFESVVAKGYSKTSSTYRQAEMKVISDKHSVEEKERKLIHSYKSFYTDCGISLEIDENVDFLDLIPSEIPVLTPVNINDFDKEKYTKLENAKWNYEINSLNRKVNKNISLGLNGGYTFNNSATSKDSIDAGISSKVGGLSLAAGVKVPVGEELKNTDFTLSATFTPNTNKKQKISERQSELEEELELLAIESAISDYESYVVQSSQNIDDILWNKLSIEESYKMYTNLEKDMKNWYSQGIIAQSEYLNAKSNAESYKVKLLENQLEILIYNNNIYGMFVSEEK